MADAPDKKPAPKKPVRKQAIRTQTGKVSLEPGKPTINIGRNIPVSGSDLIIYSCDWQFSVGPLQSFILNELGAKADEKRAIRQLPEFELTKLRDTLLAGVVSIPGRSVLNSTETEVTNAATLHINLRNFLVYLTQTSTATGRGLSLWIPLLGTGSAGLNRIQSAQIISTVLDATIFNNSDLPPPSASVPPQIENINIALPSDISDEDEAEINKIFLNRPPPAHPTSNAEMPDHFHSDHPKTDADDDDLNRDAIAKTIASNVTRVWTDQVEFKRPFAVHLSGRWGSGKSSILNYLAKHLKADKTFSDQGWVIVNYNAWRMQDAGPAWWSLRNAVAKQGYGALGWRGHWLRATDWCWRRSQLLRPWLWVALVFFLLAAVSIFFNPFSTNKTTTGAWELIAGVASSVAAFGAFLGLLSNFTKSASEKAEAIRVLQSDPTAALQKRFGKMVGYIDRPIAVLIDDLDRCNAQYIVDLLQSLQTAYAETTVLYVVASDRDWIVSAYNQTYKGFVPEISKPGLPLGYLFVKKIFQLSVSVPDLSQDDAKDLTQALLQIKKQAISAKDKGKIQAEYTTRIDDAIAAGDMNTLTQISADAAKSPVAKEIAANLMTAVGSSKIQDRLRHDLVDLVHLMDGNPRALKRLINAITFRQGYILMAAEAISFDVIARWTILDLRFPYTADAIADNPALLDPANRDQAINITHFHDPAIDQILEKLTQTDIELIRRFG